MNASALITMILAQGFVTIITVLLFWKVLKTPPKAEPDSYSDNDEVER